MVVRPFAIRPALAGIVTVGGIERVAVGTGTLVELFVKFDFVIYDVILRILLMESSTFYNSERSMIFSFQTIKTG